MLSYEEEIENMVRNNNRQEIFDLITTLSRKNSYGFYHTTGLNNLFNIYKYGTIYSRKNAEQYNIIKEDNKYKNELTKICLDKTNDFYKSKARFYLKKYAPAIHKFDIHSCCTLICDYRILFDNNLNRSISIGSAFKSTPLADVKIYNIPDDCKMLTKLPLDYIYMDCIKDGFIDENIKNYNSSEFLCENGVPIKYIKGIIFENQKDKEWFKCNFKEWMDKYNLQLIVDVSFFGGKYYDYNYGFKHFQY